MGNFGVVLDTGALVMAEKQVKTVWALKDEVHAQQRKLIVVSPVVTRAWRDGAKQAMLARFLKGCLVVEPSERLAKAAGVLLGRSGTSDAVDALVVAAALEYDASLVVTSDPGDIAHLIGSSGARTDLEIYQV
ncbi:PIN domain-containing protein [Actinorugispora endophytica]|uniref:PIN domain-containing protein n=1 Tax=Actinorugispora endophytica TaxID=1605990 RepID=A0A4R6UIX5_9ACTN|nr:PIN domain-containing protein [Actinorugispora endophytica]TDQ46870.1 PIN domain-containing protein [Actinorugispora endophytica]